MATPPRLPPGPGQPQGFLSQGQPGQSLPGPGQPHLSFFTLRSQQSRGRRPTAPPPQITVSVSAELNVSVSPNSNTPISHPARSAAAALPLPPPPHLPTSIFPSRGASRGHRTIMGSGQGQVPGHAPGSGFTPLTGPAFGTGSGSGAGVVPSRFSNRPHARVRGTGPPPGPRGLQLFTPQTPSPIRPVNIPSFIAQTSSPLGPDSSTFSVPTTPTPTSTGIMTGTMAATHSQPLGFMALKEDNTPTKEDTPTKDDINTAIKTPSITLAEATHLLKFATSPTSVDSFPTLSISVALYSPLGSFLPPLQPLILTSNTNLRSLILKLQEHLLANLRHSGSLAKLLVQSIQVRVFDLEGLETLPRIEGLLSGDEEGNAIVGKTKWIAWDATGGEGDSEKFWSALVRKLLIDVLRRGDKEGGKAPMLKVRTVVKISEFVEGELVMGERIAAGGHLFRVPPSAILPAKGVIAENIITPRGSIAAKGGKEPEKESEVAEAKGNKGKSKRDTANATSQADTQRHHRGQSGSAEKSLASTSASASFSQAELNKKFHKFHKHHKATQRSQRAQTHRQTLYMAPTAEEDKMAYAEDLLQQLNLADMAKQMSDDMMKDIKIEPGPSQINKQGEKGHYERLMGAGESEQVWVEKGGYPKDVPIDPDNNWGKFVTWGEKPTDPGYENRKALHEAFPLSHVPFNGPPCKPWSGKGKQIGVESDDDDEDEDEKGEPPMQMVPYAEIDAEEFKQKIIEERNKPENLPAHIKKYWEEQERIKGMDEQDDDTFFPASNPSVINREQAGKVFAAKEFKNPARHKNLDIISNLHGPTERRSNSAYLNSLIADGPSNMYENMPTTGTVNCGPGTIFNHSHAAADNAFKSSLQNINSFSALAKQNIKSSSPGAGFYELSKGVTTHTPVKEADSFISNLHGQDSQGYAGEINNQPIPGTSFGEFNSMAHGYAGNQTAGAYDGFNAMADGHNHGNAYNMMGGNLMGENMMGQHMMGGENTMGGNMMGGNTMGSNMMGNNMMGNSMMGGSNNQVPGSFDSFGMAAGGPSDLRGMVTHGFLQAPNLPNQGWTSMNTGGATYNTFGSHSSSFNPRATANTPHSRAMGSFPQDSQSGVPTPTPLGRIQSRFFNPMDSARASPGNERFAFNNMAVPSNPTHPAAGSFVNPMATPTNPNHPAAGSFVHGSSRSHTHNLHVGSNPTAASRARRAAIPIVAPPGAASVPGFQLPSPTRQAIGYGAGVGSAAPLGMGTPGNVRRTPSPKKASQKASMEVFSAAIASAFNGPQGSPSGGNNA